MESSDPLNPIWEGPETTFNALRGAISEQEADSGGEPYFWLQLALSRAQQEVDPIEFGRILISLKRLGFDSDLLENFRNSNFDFPVVIEADDYGAYRIFLEVPSPNDITEADWKNARTNMTPLGYRVPIMRYGRDYILGPMTRENEFSYRVFAALGMSGQIVNESRIKGTMSVSVPYEEGLAEIIVKAGKKNLEKTTWS